MIQVDKNVELPALDGRTKYPWAEMEVGDSFLVTGVEQRSISTTAGTRSARYGEKYVTRSVVENGEKGGRVWRVK